MREPARVLVTVEVPSPEQLPPVLIELLRPFDVVLLGWYALPDQTAPEQAREQFGEDCEESLASVAAAFREHGTEVETELVFSPDRVETVERTAAERPVEAVLLTRPSYRMERVLVAVRDPSLGREIVDFVAAMLLDRARRVELLRVVDEEDAPRARRAMLDLEERLLSASGLDPEMVRARIEVGTDPASVLLRAADDHDLVVIGETEPTIRERIFGDFARRLGDEAELPVLVVRAAREDADAAGDGAGNGREDTPCRD